MYSVKKNKWLVTLFAALFTVMLAVGCGSGSRPEAGGDETGTGEVTDEKPVIYVYGEEDGQEVNVTLQTEQKITCEYPQRPDGEDTWYVKANKDGSLKYYSSADERTMDSQIEGTVDEYNYLFWEGKTNAKYDFSKGFCVAGRDSASFLEQKLAEIGLNRKEANEFIVYWLPKMQKNKYNIVSFQKDVYENEFRLSSTPSAKMLRVFMAFKASDKEVEIPAQDLSVIKGDFNRDGLTIVEWGGAVVK